MFIFDSTSWIFLIIINEFVPIDDEQDRTVVFND